MVFPTESAARRYAKSLGYKVSCVEYHLNRGARVQVVDKQTPSASSPVLTLKVQSQ